MGIILNRRRVMGGYKVRPLYIQNGLMGWFDGEWNQDVGVHNSSATTWVNLADKGNDITDIDNSFTWGDNYLLPPVQQAVGTIPSFDRAKTIEAVLTFTGDNFIAVINPTSFTNRWIALRANNTVNFISSGKCAPCPRNQIVSLSSITSYYDSTTTKIFVNGIDKTGGIGAIGNGSTNCFNATYSWGRGTAYFYCLRFYNRELTDEEVLYNYNIDKERYGL